MAKPVDRKDQPDLEPQRRAILRSLTYVNLQITTLREEIVCIEKRMCSLKGDWPYGAPDGLEAA